MTKRMPYFTVARERGGWIVIDPTGGAEPDTRITDRQTALAAAEALNVECREWERQGLADAPHMDAGDA